MAEFIEIPPLEGAAHPPLGPIDVGEAVSRVVVYCSTRLSGWAVYDVAAEALRPTGLFDAITPWSLNWANLLNGRATVTDVARFDVDHRKTLAGLLARIPLDTPLETLEGADLEAVVAVCAFGFSGVWAAKTTKMAALYRPAAVPVLDGHIATAFGFAQNDFAIRARRSARYGRTDKIRFTVHSLRQNLRDNATQIQRVREELVTMNPTASFISDLRLLDIILWTTEDSRRAVAAGKGIHGSPTLKRQSGGGRL